MKKNKKGSSLPVSLEKTKRTVKLRRLLLLAVSFIVIYGVYAAGCHFQFKPIVPIYFIALLGLLVAFIILNRGIDTKLPERGDLPEEWSEGQKTDYLERAGKRRVIARRLLFFIIPLLLTFAIDLVYLSFFAGLNL